MEKNNLTSQGCAICGKNTSFTVLYPANFKVGEINKDIFSARRNPDRRHYRLVRCRKCGLIFSNPIFKESKIKRLYEQSELTYDAELGDLKKTYGDYLKKISKNIFKNNLLEIGCGNGFFLGEAKSQGFKNVFGVEPSLKAVEKAHLKIRKNIKVDIFKDKLYQNNFFDIICFFQTLDHIIDPNKFLKSCFRILKNGGIVFCIVHDTNSLMVKILGEKTPIFDIEHTYLYNKKTLKKIFEKNNFEIVKILDIANEYSLKYWLNLLPLGGFKRKISDLLVYLGIQDKKVRLRPGNIGIVAQKSENYLL